MAHGLNSHRMFNKSPPLRRRPVVEGMEPRILYSADGLAGVLDPLHATDTYSFDAQPVLLLHANDAKSAPHQDHAAITALATPPAPAPDQAPSIELVVVDARVSDYQSLIVDC